MGSTTPIRAGSRSADEERAPRERGALSLTFPLPGWSWSGCWRWRRWCRSAGERAKEIAQDPASLSSSDRQVDSVEVHHQTEQVQVERSQDEVQDRTDLAHLLGLHRRNLNAETGDPLLIEAVCPCGPRHLRRRPLQLRRGTPRSGDRAEERAEDPPVRVRRDQQVHSIEIDDQPQQLQMELLERKLEHGTNARRSRVRDPLALEPCGKRFTNGGRSPFVRLITPDHCALGDNGSSLPYEPVDDDFHIDRVGFLAGL